MGTLKIDFSQIPSREPIAVGIHRAVVSAVDLHQPTESTKSPYISWTYEVADGPDAGKTVRDMTSLAPQALWRLESVIFALTGESLDAIDLAYDEVGTITAPRFVGKPVEIEIRHEEYEGRQRPRVYSVNAPKSKLGAASPASSKVLK